MKFFLAICCCFLFVGTANAIPTSADWQTADDGLITYDDNTKLEWLDLTVTAGISYNTVSSQLGAGGAYEGFRYATSAEISTLWDSFGGDGVYNGWSATNNGIFDIIAPLMGDLECVIDGCTAGEGMSRMITGELNVFGTLVSLMGDSYTATNSATKDFFSLINSSYALDTEWQGWGSALIRDRVKAPEPGILALMCIGLTVIGFTRRKKA